MPTGTSHVCILGLKLLAPPRTTHTFLRAIPGACGTRERPHLPTKISGRAGKANRAHAGGGPKRKKGWVGRSPTLHNQSGFECSCGAALSTRGPARVGSVRRRCGPRVSEHPASSEATLDRIWITRVANGRPCAPLVRQRDRPKMGPHGGKVAGTPMVPDVVFCLRLALARRPLAPHCRCTDCTYELLSDHGDVCPQLPVLRNLPIICGVLLARGLHLFAEPLHCTL